jgi:hypothetical protein
LKIKKSYLLQNVMQKENYQITAGLCNIICVCFSVFTNSGQLKMLDVGLHHRMASS